MTSRDTIAERSIRYLSIAAIVCNGFWMWAVMKAEYVDSFLRADSRVGFPLALCWMAFAMGLILVARLVRVCSHCDFFWGHSGSLLASAAVISVFPPMAYSVSMGFGSMMLFGAGMAVFFPLAWLGLLAAVATIPMDTSDQEAPQNEMSRALRRFSIEIIYFGVVLLLNVVFRFVGWWPVLLLGIAAPLVAEAVASRLDPIRGHDLSGWVWFTRMVSSFLGCFLPFTMGWLLFGPFGDTRGLLWVLPWVQALVAGIAFVWWHRFLPWRDQQGHLNVNPTGSQDSGISSPPCK
ncbi:MAG: hypothetical protein K1X53_15150 [Candidatus Sumerlaeaceae bacterium]|nr:hypothetical protein [Candidatus Sumerlaeaceae bacterium]